MSKKKRYQTMTGNSDLNSSLLQEQPDVPFKVFNVNNSEASDYENLGKSSQKNSFKNLEVQLHG